jgi:hypothetical protein
MAGIPGVLLSPLKKALASCDDVFVSHQALSFVFIDERLALWQSDLLEASNRGQRVEFTIGYLYDKYRVDRTNALVLFLTVLAERYEDERRDRLQALSEQLSWFLRLPATRQEAIRQEANPLSAPMLLVAEAEKMLSCARGVARVTVLPSINGRFEAQKETGTGWLIAPGLLLTCWHVIEARSVYDPPLELIDLKKQVANMLVTFDYTAVGRGIEYNVERLACPTLESQTLDYALLYLQDRDDYPLSRFHYLHLDTDVPRTAQTELYIIQHPLGRHQQVAGDYFQGESSRKGRILYRTPTEPGTSGAPVFNRNTWRVVALHNGESEYVKYREGTLLSHILKDISKLQPGLYNTILSAQNR